MTKTNHKNKSGYTVLDMVLSDYNVKEDYITMLKDKGAETMFLNFI